MKRAVLTLAIISSLASLAACVSAPTGPTIAIMPREGKPFDVFQQEDQQCREFAANASKDTSNASLKEGATSAAIGAAIGAAAGAVIQGGSSQNIGTGAGIFAYTAAHSPAKYATLLLAFGTIPCTCFRFLHHLTLQCCFTSFAAPNLGVWI